MEAIDAGWTPGQNLVAEIATEAPVAAAAPTNLQAEPQPEPVELAETAQAASSGSPAGPLLVVTVTSGVLAVAGVVAWSRVGLMQRLPDSRDARTNRLVSRP